MYDDIAYLYTATEGQDDYGNIINRYSERQVFAKPRSIYQNEFYNAATVGLKPELTLVLSNPEEYKGEKIAKFHGVFYDVIRIFQRPEKDTVELTLQSRVGIDDEVVVSV